MSFILDEVYILYQIFFALFSRLTLSVFGALLSPTDRCARVSLAIQFFGRSTGMSLTWNSTSKTLKLADQGRGQGSDAGKTLRHVKIRQHDDENDTKKKIAENRKKINHASIGRGRDWQANASRKSIKT
jgi:hypothetical protein